MKIKSIVLFFMFAAYSGFAQNVNTIDNRNSEPIYAGVDIPASPEGGLQKFYYDFAKAFKTPHVPDNSITQLRIMLAFVVEKDGSFSDIKVLRDPGFGAGAEAIRVLQLMPRWTSSLLEGKPVRSQFTFPITIKVR